MGAPAAAVAARFAWVGYKDRIPFLNRRPGDPPPGPEDERAQPDVEAERQGGQLAEVDGGAERQAGAGQRDDGDLVEAGAPPP